ncbi:MAG: hypothetical protein WKF81_07890, partial [Thermomicrobiales bacterium]
NSPNQNSNCNGRVEEAEGTDVTFEVRAGFDVTDGPVLETIEVSIVQQGNASQGSATGGALDAGETFTVCEIPVDGFTPVPRPGNQGGSNQTLVAGEPCITVELGPGNNELQFNNFIAAAPTATNTPEPTATNTPEPTATNTPEPTATNISEPTSTEVIQPTPTMITDCDSFTFSGTLAFSLQLGDCASPVAETPEPPSDDLGSGDDVNSDGSDGNDDGGSVGIDGNDEGADGSAVTVVTLPSTGDGSDASGGHAFFMVLGMSLLVTMAIAVAVRRKYTTSN